MHHRARPHLLASSPMALWLALLAAPLLGSFLQGVMAGADLSGWHALWQDSQTVSAWGLSVWSGLASTALALLASAFILSRSKLRVRNPARGTGGWMLAVPHAAFAVGLALLIAPSGWLLRLLSPWATGLEAPPPWPTTQDPWGLGLVAVLVLKETPFLLWAASAQLQRPDVAQRLGQEMQLAATLGYGEQVTWWRIVWPQLLPRLAGPLLAVCAYSLTVVDVALVIGPASPPTLATLAWHGLMDADAQRNAQGAAAAWLLAATVVTCAALGWLALNANLWRRQRTQGARPVHGMPGRWPLPLPPLHLLNVAYAAVLAALLLGSFMGPWPFPALLPKHWHTAAWDTALGSSSALLATLGLALASALSSLVWATVWLEWAPPRWLTPLRALAYLPLVLPGVLWVLGMHQLCMYWGLESSVTGVWLAHTLAAVPYVLLTLQGPYQDFDARLYAVAATLGHSRWHFLLRIKWPLLRASLAAAFAAGFAVSVAQYLPTLYIGGGRISTVTTEAVSLAAGGQRNLMAAFAWLQCMLPLAAFGIAAWVGHTPRFPRARRGLASRTNAIGTIGT